MQRVLGKMCPSGGWIGQHFVVPNWLDPVLTHSPLSWQTIGCIIITQMAAVDHTITCPWGRITIMTLVLVCICLKCYWLNAPCKNNYALFYSHHSTKDTGSTKKCTLHDMWKPVSMLWTHLKGISLCHWWDIWLPWCVESFVLSPSQNLVVWAHTIHSLSLLYT